MEIRGNIVALVTPFRNGEIDRKSLTAGVQRALSSGVTGLVPCGTTGESPTLSHDEHDRVVAHTVEVAGGRVPVIAGTGSNSTAEAVRLSQAAARHGASALLSVTPYYNRPSQPGLVHHFRAVADSTELPVVLYDIPGRTGVAMTMDSLAALAEHPNIQAVKLATGNVEQVTRIRRATSLSVLSGDDSLTLPMMALGAQGVVSVISNLLPGEMSRLVAAAAEGDFPGALRIHDRLHPLMTALFLETNPVPIKTAMARIGWITEELRPPLCPMSDENRAALEKALEPFLPQIL